MVQQVFSVPFSSNFTEESGTFVDVRNQIVIQIINQTIPKNQGNTYSKIFTKQFNATQINSTGLPENIMAFKPDQGRIIVLVIGEKQTAVIMTSNQDLAIKMAKSVKFNG